MDGKILENEYYNSRFEKYGNTAEGVGWKNKTAQHIRFEQLLKIISEDKPATLSDIGCGFGHFYEYLSQKGFGNISYTGYDISKKMIKIAKEMCNNNSDKCKFTHIKDISEIATADYSVASGIFNIKDNMAEDKWLSYILNTMKEMDKKSVKAFGFNMLTKYSDLDCMENKLYYSDPGFIFDFCKKNFSKNVALLHDYNEYDFTVLVKKY